MVNSISPVAGSYVTAVGVKVEAVVAPTLTSKVVVVILVIGNHLLNDGSDFLG